MTVVGWIRTRSAVVCVWEAGSDVVWEAGGDVAVIDQDELGSGLCVGGRSPDVLSERPAAMLCRRLAVRWPRVAWDPCRCHCWR